MGATTVPEEIFGATDITRLLQDKIMVRDTEGFLPTAQIAFVDEVFKGNSAILNTMLRIVNERKYKDGRNEIDVPLISMFSASNELPQDASLKAFFDRFICRMVVNPIKIKGSFRAMLEGASFTAPKVLSPKLIKEMQLEVDAITISENFYDMYFDLRCQLANDIPKLHVSDRKYKQMIKFAKAHCYLMGGTELTEDYLPFLVDCLWEEVDQIKDISKILANYMSPTVSRANNLYNECMAFIDSADKATNYSDLSKAYSELKERFKEIEGKIISSPEQEPFLREIIGKLDPAMKRLRTKVVKMAT